MSIWWRVGMIWDELVFIFGVVVMVKDWECLFFVLILSWCDGFYVVVVVYC